MNHLLITFSDGKKYTIPVTALAEDIVQKGAKCKLLVIENPPKKSMITC